MKYLLLAFVVAALVAGCASTQTFKGAEALKGEPIEKAFDVLGYPDKKEQFGNDTVYYWNRGTDFHYASLRIAAGSDGIIKSYSADGNEGGYEYFARQLGRYASQKNRQ